MLFANVSVTFSDGRDRRHRKELRCRQAKLGRLVHLARAAGFDTLVVRAYAGDGRTGETLCIVTLYG